MSHKLPLYLLVAECGEVKSRNGLESFEGVVLLNAVLHLILEEESGTAQEALESGCSNSAGSNTKEGIPIYCAFFNRRFNLVFR